MENHPGFRLSPKMMHSMIYAVCYGDLIMSLVNQVRPYETNAGEAEALADKWTAVLGAELANEKIRYRRIKDNYRKIIADFAKIPMNRTKKPKVGVVGEIFVKYSPLANNDLERFLIKEGAEVVVPGLIDFCLYTIYNSIMDYKLYGKNKKTYPVWKFAFWLFNKKKNDISQLIKEEGTFDGWTEFDKIIDIASGVISLAVKMGEGWLLTSEMVELAESGCTNIVCTQPFGCLPNHICGKGMMKPLKELMPDINIVAIDYDAGASRVNQENRLKLMLSNAKRIMESKA